MSDTYESLEAQHKILKDENKRREHKLLFEAIDNLTAERNALRSEVERIRRETVEECAKFVEPQRNDVPATGIEFAQQSGVI